MSQENVEIVRTAYEGYSRRSVEQHRHLFADDFKFNMRPEFPTQDSYGIGEITQLWADLDETFTDYELAPTDFAEVGDYVLVTLATSAQLKDADTRIASTIFHLWHVVDGLVRQAWTFGTRAEALEAVGLRE